MSDLLINSLQVRNFRVFDTLNIERLGRVNLITGKNNVGKSTLLEALWLYASRGSGTVFRDVLDMRDELNNINQTSSRNGLSTGAMSTELEKISDLRFLFHGRPNIGGRVKPINIGPLNPKSKLLSIEIGWFTSIENPDDAEAPAKLVPVSADGNSGFEDASPYLTIRMGNRSRRTPATRLFTRTGVSIPTGLSNATPHQFIRANGLDAVLVSQLWDGTQLTDAENIVLESLRIIAPNVERVSVRVQQGRSQGPIPIVKIAGVNEVVPLRSFGDGMSRLFGIILALVNAKDGMLIMDEIENGLHYSVMPDVWRLISKVARRLNVQVFATTHSWDCVKAFQTALQEDEHEEGLLIRLEAKDGHIVATEFDEQMLGIATDERIEVR